MTYGGQPRGRCFAASGAYESWLCSHPRRWPRSGCARQPVASIEILDAQPPVSDPVAPQAADGATVVARGSAPPTRPDRWPSGASISTCRSATASAWWASRDRAVDGPERAGWIPEITPATCAWAGGSCLNSQATTFVRWCRGPTQIPHVFDADVAANCAWPSRTPPTSNCSTH